MRALANAKRPMRRRRDRLIQYGHVQTIVAPAVLPVLGSFLRTLRRRSAERRALLRARQGKPMSQLSAPSDAALIEIYRRAHLASIHCERTDREIMAGRLRMPFHSPRGQEVLS